jgi:hypothetical protein
MFNVPSFFGFRSGGESFDPDALAFFGRVDTATGVSDYLTLTEKNAVNDLVIQMKADLIWTSMKAIYPMVGGGNGTLAQNQAACEQNLVSASFTGTFTSGWTFASTGATGDVFSSTYMDTSLTPSGSLSQDSTHLSFYSRSTGNIATNMVDMGSYDGTSGNATYMVTSYGSIIYPNVNSTNLSAGATPYTNRLGFKMFNRVDSSNVRVFNNGTFLQTYARTSTTLNNLSLYVGAYHRNDITTFSNDLECAFASIGDGLTDAESLFCYNAVQAFNTTLSRQV